MMSKQGTPAHRPEYPDSAYSAPQVRRQLQQILESVTLRGANGRRRFLEYVVEETIAGRSGDLKQQTIALHVMGQGDGFDPAADTRVRSEAKRLRKSLTRYYETEGKRDLIRIHLPTGTYAPVFTQNRAVRDPLTGRRARSPTRSNSVGAPIGTPSIVVLAFEDLTPTNSQEHIAAAVTERLLVELSHRRDLYLVGPVAASPNSDQPVSPGAAAREWGVRFVLGGSIQLSESLRTTASVWDGSNGRLLWGEAFDRSIDAESLLAVEDAVASDIVPRITDDFGLINRTLALEPSRPHRGPLEAAVALYRAVSTPTSETLSASIAATERVLTRHPSDATCAATLAALHALDYYTGHGDQVALDRSEEMVRRSVSVDAACQHAHLILAFVHFLRRRRAACIECIDHALALDWNQPTVLGFGSVVLSMVGEYERAETLNVRAQRLNPSCPAIYNAAPFIVHYVRGEFDRALFHAERHTTPGSYLDPLYRAAALGELGQLDAARTVVRELESECPDIAERWSDLFRRALFLDEHVECVRRGLVKAGLVLGH